MIQYEQQHEILDKEMSLEEKHTPLLPDSAAVAEVYSK